MRACTLERRETLRSTFRFVKIEIAGAVYNPKDFLNCSIDIRLIAASVKALAWLKKEEEKNKIDFWLVAALLPWRCWRAILMIF